METGTGSASETGNGNGNETCCKTGDETCAPRESLSGGEESQSDPSCGAEGVIDVSCTVQRMTFFGRTSLSRLSQ